MLERLLAGPLGARAGAQRTYRRGLKVAGRSESHGGGGAAADVRACGGPPRAAGDDDSRGARAHRAACVRATARRRGGRRDAVAGVAERRRRSARRIHDGRTSRWRRSPGGCSARRAGAWRWPSPAPAACWRAPDRRARQFGLGRRRRDRLQQRVEDGLADVPAALIAEHGAVSEPVAARAGRRGARRDAARRWGSASPASPVLTAAPRPSRRNGVRRSAHARHRRLPAGPLRR